MNDVRAQHAASLRPLPPGWRWVRLRDVIDSLETGARPKGGAVGIATGVPSLSAEHMNKFGTLEFEPRRFVTREFFEKMSRGRIKPGDILVVKDGATTGKTAFVGDEPWLLEAVINEHVFLCRPNPDLVQPQYLFHWLWGPEGQSAIKMNYQGSAIGGISQKFAESALVPLPPLPEQCRIVAVLSEQMDAVAKARVATESQLEAARALPAAYLRAVFNSLEAQGFPRKRLGDVCSIMARQVDPKIPEYGQLPHVNGENIESGLCRLTYLKTASENGMISGKYLFEAGNVLYSKLRPYLRKALVATFRGVCSADMYPISVNTELVEPHFAAWMLVSDPFSKYADEESQRSRMPKLNREQLLSWYAPLPPLPEQRRIVAILSEQMAAVEKARQALEAQLDAINRLTAALLRQAFNGEI